MATYSNSVTDDSGYARPIEGVQVFTLNRDGSTASGVSPQPAITDAYGLFTISVPDGFYTLDYRLGGVSYAKEAVTIGTPPETVGPTGPANNTYTSYSALLASDPTRQYAYLVGDTDSPPQPDGVFSNPTKVAGAWVRQKADGVAFKAAAPTAVVRSAQDKAREVVSVKDFGATGDGATNDTAAIQAAMTAVDAADGGTVLFPTGNYKITSDINVPGTVSIDGYGQFSRILANGCNGLNVQASDVIGPRRIANVWIQGNGADAFAGIKVDLAFPTRATGMVIENCYISFFGTGILSRGLWHSTIRTNTINQVHRAIVLYDRNVKVTVSDNRGTWGGLIGGTGLSIGLQVGDETVGLRPEDVQAHDNIFVGFAQGCYWRQGLFGAVTHNDFDYCTDTGILIVTADGGSTFSHNWIQVDNTETDVYGIRGVALGSLPGLDNIEIHNNRMRATDVKIVAGEFHSFGLDFANNQANINAVGNSVQGAFQVSMNLNGVQRSNFRDNRGEGQSFIFNCARVLFDGNTHNGGVTLSGNADCSFGKDFGLHTTAAFGSIPVPAGATTATVTFVSLNMPDLPLGTYGIAVTATDRGNLTHGGIAVVPTRTGLTVYCQTAIASLPSIIDFQLRIY